MSSGDDLTPMTPDPDKPTTPGAAAGEADFKSVGGLTSDSEVSDYKEGGVSGGSHEGGGIPEFKAPDPMTLEAPLQFDDYEPDQGVTPARSGALDAVDTSTDDPSADPDHSSTGDAGPGAHSSLYIGHGSLLSIIDDSDPTIQPEEAHTSGDPSLADGGDQGDSASRPVSPPQERQFEGSWPRTVSIEEAYTSEISPTWSDNAGALSARPMLPDGPKSPRRVGRLLPPLLVGLLVLSAAGVFIILRPQAGTTTTPQLEMTPTTAPTVTSTPQPTNTPAPQATNTPIPAAPAHLGVSPTQTVEYCANGQWPNALTVHNSGGRTLSWSATASAAGVTVTLSPASGSVAPGASTSVSLGGQGPAPGNTFSVHFTSNGGSATITISCQ